ncbi:hypothetical protein OAS95_04265 [Pelagibacteraceae bacterium]|nr:hypothetical protein [Pelagibacteraceae bacterium]
MSSTSAPTTPLSNSPVKKTRAPVLSEKYSKFIQFSHYMMSQMESDTFTKEEFLNSVQMFATVEEQQTFIQGFFDNQKDNKKAMRQNIQNRKKENQPKKVRVPRKTKKVAAAVEPTQETDTQENLIESLTDELTEEPMINKIGAAIEIAEDITAKKPREKKAAGEKKARVVKKKAAKEQEPTTESTTPL